MRLSIPLGQLDQNLLAAGKDDAGRLLAVDGVRRPWYGVLEVALQLGGEDPPVVVEIGVQLLRVLSVSGLFIAVALTYTGGLQGTGDTRSPLYISVISQIIVPLGTCAVIRATGTLDPIDIWLAILAGHATRCTLSVLRFRQGKWRNIVVD